MHLSELERRVTAIEDRNRRVENDKAWERSMTRTASIGFLTYTVAVLVLWMLGNAQFLLSALVPTAGFILSMQSLPIVRTWWMKNRR